MRRLTVNTIHFGVHSFEMLTFQAPWGEDDRVVAAVRDGPWETEALRWWLAMIERPGVCVDVGAYSGFYALLAAATGSRCVAFEAASLTYGRLTHNISVNAMWQNIIPEHAAVAGQAGNANLSHAFGLGTMASGETLTDAAGSPDHFESVRTVRLDEALGLTGKVTGNMASRSAKLLPIDEVAAVKIDVEGAEFDVLNGAPRLLLASRPPLLIEVLEEDNLRRCRKLLRNAGYVEVDQCAGGNFVFVVAEAVDELRAARERVAAPTLHIEERFGVQLD